MYDQAIVGAPKDARLLGNRSAAHLALGLYQVFLCVHMWEVSPDTSCGTIQTRSSATLKGSCDNRGFNHTTRRLARMRGELSSWTPIGPRAITGARP